VRCHLAEVLVADDAGELVGTWTVHFMRWTWEYTFTADGKVTWRDPLNNESGSGRWALMGSIVNLTWTNSTEKETWNRPIRPGDQIGWCVASYGTGKIEAKKAGGGASAGLKDDLRTMANRSDFKFGSNYDQVHDRITKASAQEKREALSDQPLLTLIRHKMLFNDFAMAVELLGRQSPTGKQLTEDAVVKSACEAAWADSNVNASNPNDWRENGGYIFMNLVSGQVSTARVPSGNWGGLNLPGPEIKDIPDDSIVVGVFHTHPNPDGAGTCEDHDVQKSKIDGVPDVVRGAKGPFPCGVERRLHLAGSRGYPGPSGGDPP